MIAEELIKKANDCNKDAHTVLSFLDDISIRKFVNDNKNSLSKNGCHTLELLNKHELLNGLYPIIWTSSKYLIS